jgi:FkbM family methyltransferase
MRARTDPDVIATFKTTVPPMSQGLIRELFDRLRGLTRSSLIYEETPPKETPLTHEEIATLIKKQNPTILEIGCNDGTDTLAFLRVMPEAKIYCFEPDPRAVKRFKQRMGSYLDKVKLFEVAISDQTGQIDFHQSCGDDLPHGLDLPDGLDLPGGWDFSGSIRRPKHHLIEHPWVKFEKTITVSTCRLDDWSAENGVKQVDFIWMDVQGAEGDVIAGASKILKHTRFLYSEYSNTETYEGQLSLKALLAQLPSFVVIARYPEDVLLRNKKFRMAGASRWPF